MRINVPIASAMSRLQLSRRHQLDASDVPLSDDRAPSRRVTRPFTDDCLATCVRQSRRRYYKSVDFGQFLSYNLTIDRARQLL